MINVALPSEVRGGRGPMDFADHAAIVKALAKDAAREGQREEYGVFLQTFPRKPVFRSQQKQML